MSTQKGISPKQSKVIEGLLGGLTQEQAAQAAGVAAQTVSRWMHQPDFWSALRDASEQGLKVASGRMMGGMGGAVDVIEAILQDAQAPASVKLRAAQVYLDSGLRLADAANILERIEALEARLS
jgi:transcriptional regulator with XRE-family HTH domain